MKLLVLVDKITPRVEYSFGHVLGDLFGLEFELTTDREEFSARIGPKFSYGKASMNGPHFGSVELLSEEGIRSFEPDHSTHDGISTYFKVDQGELSFDPFAATFYTLSRYEEYTTPDRDEHGRFQAEKSTLTCIGALERPVVDHWALMVAGKIAKAFPEIQLKFEPATDLITVDVDNTFAYKGRGLRSKAAMVKAKLQGSAEEANERKAVLFGNAQDPYDNYKKICEAVEDPKSLIFFVLFAERGPHDHGVDPSSADLQDAIRTMAKGGRVGIHPSYASSDSKGIMESERQGLGNVLGKAINLSRQHFLRFDLPNTYRRLIASGINEDHTMGYADRCGFRAGTCRPFKWYDLEREETTVLVIIPFATMDTAFADHQKLSPSETQARIEEIRKNVRAVDGPLVTVWHDRVLSDRAPYEGWWQVFLDSVGKGK